MSASPKFDYKQPQPTVQQLRENALLSLINDLEMTEWQYLSREAIRLKRENVLDRLQEREPELFGELSLSSFNKFWTEQKICKLASGKPRSS